MKYAMLLVALMVGLLTIPCAQAVESINVSTTPDFAFNGDVVTIEVRGTPMASAFVNIIMDVDVVDEGYIRLNSNGSGVWEWVVKPDAPAGNYLIAVTVGGVTRNGSIEILWSDVAYLRWVVNNQQMTINQMHDQIVAHSRMLVEMDKRQDVFDTTAFIVSLVVIIGVTATLVIWRRWILWTMVRNEGKRGRFQILRGRRLPVHGDHSRYIDGVGAVTDRAKEAREPETEEKFMLLKTKGDRILSIEDNQEIVPIASMDAGMDLLRKDIDHGMPSRLESMLDARRKRKAAKAAGIVPMVVDYHPRLGIMHRRGKQPAIEVPELYKAPEAVPEPQEVVEAPVAPKRKRTPKATPKVAPAPVIEPAPVAQDVAPAPKVVKKPRKRRPKVVKKEVEA